MPAVSGADAAAKTEAADGPPKLELVTTVMGSGHPGMRRAGP